MKILVTGANGFIGKNICVSLKESGHTVIPYDVDTTKTMGELIPQADFIMHFAGINRPIKEEEFTQGNVNLTQELVDVLKQQPKQIPLLFSSSIQAALDNSYGRSKKEAEDCIFAYGKETGNPVFVYRLENAFGKWSKPNYNSVVATFCHNVASGKEIQVNDPDAKVHFVYIDDIVKEFLSCLQKEGSLDILHVQPTYEVTIGQLAEMIKSFKESRNTHMIMDLRDGFEKKLYSTYLSYLPEDSFSYPLDMHVDHRGSFTEFVKTIDRGQVSVNVAHPGIIKGNHYHHSKNEKFLVVYGEAVIRFRKLGEEKIITYHVSGDKLEVVDIPTGYTHQIENVGKTDLVTIMWANELLDQEHPDTFFEEV